MSDTLSVHNDGCSVVTSQHISNQEIKAQPCSATNEHRDNWKDDIEKTPLYFPQPDREDEHSIKNAQTTMSLDPWTTSKVTCSLKDNITGLKPVTNRYSITLFGPSEWQAHNLKLFQRSNEKIWNAQVARSEAKQCVEQSYKAADKVQLETTECLKTRANLVYRRKTQLEQAITALAQEKELLETERRRVKKTLSVLNIPTSIAGEFLHLRSFRLEPDLVRDEVEDQLIKEITLCTEIDNSFNEIGEHINRQIVELKMAKNRIESDWSDKTHAYNVESTCINLSNDSPLISWKAGAARFPADQSTLTSYEHFTQETLAAGETARQKSTSLRSTLNTMYTNLIKDLRDQAMRVDIALAEKIKLTQDVLYQLELELRRCLQELVNTEKLLEELRNSTKGLNNAMKLAQTRLNNRSSRRNIENCRDEPQCALIEEVKFLGEQSSAMMAELKRVEIFQAELVRTRGALEHEIMVKRKTLYIDKERGQLLRSCYPSTVALSGFE